MVAAPVDVTICIPAYRSADFILRTLEAVRMQTYRAFKALVSIDGHDPATEAVCRRFAGEDERFEVIVQPERLGWLGNANALLDRVATEFFCIMPHDDLIAATYIETLRSEALAHPEALVVFCDMERIGWRHDFRSTPNLNGPFRARLASLLSAPTEGVAWRGLTRSSVLSTGRRMRTNGYENYNAHALWVTELLSLGPFRHVPRPLYQQWERVDSASVTTGWRTWPAERLYAAMAEYTLQCIEIVSTVGEAEAADRQAVVLLLVLRLLAHPAAAKAIPAEAASVDRNLIHAAELLARTAGLPYPGASAAGELRKDPAIRRFMAALRLKDGMEAMAVKDLGAAAVAFDAATALDPENGEVQFRRAQLLRQLGEIDAALSAIRTAQTLLPRHANVHVELTTLLLRAGNVVEAVAAARTAVDLDPKLANAHYHLAIALRRSGRPQEAREAIDAAVALEPDKERFLAYRDKIEREQADAIRRPTEPVELIE